MENIKSIWIRTTIALFGALLLNLTILFTIPPTTTPGIIVKDISSLIVFILIYFKILRKDS